MTLCGCDTLEGNITLDSSGSAGAYVHVVSSPSIAGQGALRFDQGATNFFTLWTENTGSTSASVLYLGFDGTTAAANAKLAITGGGNLGIGTTTPGYPLDVNGTIRMTGALLGGDQLMSGALKDSTGTRTNVDAGGCYYAN